MNKTTKISELSEFFPDNTVSDKRVLVKGRAKPLRGEMQKQCEARRAATAERIERKLQHQSFYQSILSSEAHISGAIYKDEISNTLHALAVKNGANETARSAGNFCFKSIVELKSFVQEYEREADDWIPVDSSKDVPVGHWLVTLEEEVHRSNLAVCIVILNAQKHRMATVGSHFDFDMPRVIAYKALPEAYSRS